MDQTSGERGDIPASLPVPPDHVSLHFAGRNGVLLDAARQMLFAADPAATLLWCCLAESMTRDETLARLCEATGLDPRDASSILDATLARWREAGLFDPPPPESDRPSPAEPTSPRSRSRAGTRHAAARGAAYRLLDTGFTLACDDPAIHATATDPILHLRHPGAGADAIAIEIAQGAGGYVLRRDGMEEARCAEARELGPLVLALMSWLAVERSGAACAIHAGAVVEGGALVLLAGPAGTGKSTLVAGLASTGLCAACDDTVLLEGDPLAARPVSVGLCLKEPAWPVLRDVLPALSRRPIHRRPDGLTVRYLAGAPGPQASDGMAMPVERVVFPRHDPDARTGTIEALDTGTALAALSPHIHFLERRLDAALVERLIAWIGAIPCFRLRYATLEDALRLFAESRP